MKAYAVSCTVVGRGIFPIDMLRYDQLYPRGSDDAAKIAACQNYEERHSARDADGVVRITVSGIKLHRYWEPTIARWSSFGWSVDPQSVKREEL